MLANVIKKKQSRFTALAEAWLAMGATAFSIWEGEQLLQRWPATSEPLSPPNGNCVTAQVGTEMLVVEGLNGSETESRLRAEADLIADLARAESEMTRLEDDLDLMTEELVNAQDHLLAMYNLTQSTRSSLKLDQILVSLLQETLRLTQAKGMIITLNSDSYPMLVEQTPDGLFDTFALQKLFRRTQESENELLMSTDDAFFENTKAIDAESAFFKIIPIRDRRTIMLGLLMDKPAAVLSPYIKLTRALAEQASAQLEHVMLYQDTLDQARMKMELKLAARIQLQLLPREAPEVAGVDIAAASRPAHQVGGDFYDFRVAANDLLTLVLGDVSGKGVSAAMVMAMIRTVFRSITKQQPVPNPEEIMELCNRDLYDDLTDLGMFASTFIAQYSPNEDLFYYANAGHSPVVFCPADADAFLLEADGPPVGMLDVNLSMIQSTPFKTGDLIILATDGFNETNNASGDMYGTERFLELIKAVSHQSAQDIMKALYRAVDDFGGDRSQDDDRTIVVIKRV